jgi:hypothetical protein
MYSYIFQSVLLLDYGIRGSVPGRGRDLSSQPPDRVRGRHSPLMQWVMEAVSWGVSCLLTPTKCRSQECVKLYL